MLETCILCSIESLTNLQKSYLVKLRHRISTTEQINFVRCLSFDLSNRVLFTFEQNIVLLI